MNDLPDSCPIPPDSAELGRLRSALDGLERSRLTRNGTDGRVYGGDPNLIHIADGTRATMGAQLATMLDMSMRMAALESGARTEDEMMYQALCPGCYMVALYDAALALAEANGQDVKELGRSMANIFSRLAQTGDSTPVEEIDVITDEQLATTPNIAGFILPHMENL